MKYNVTQKAYTEVGKVMAERGKMLNKKKCNKIKENNNKID